MTAGSAPALPSHPTGKKQLRRVILGALGAIVIGLTIAFFTPPVTQATTTMESWWGRVVGVDKPIELKPICAKQGGIVPPPAEKNAAFHWRCKGSSHPITPQQIAERCAAQWGPEFRLMLRDRDASSGWKCHKRGLLK